MKHQLRYILSICFVVFSIAIVHSQATEGRFAGLVWSPDNLHLVIGTESEINVHSALDLSVVSTISTEKLVTAITWGSDANEIIYGTADGKVYLHDINSNQTVFRLSVFDSSITSLVWNQNKDTLAIAGWNQQIFLWDSNTMEIIESITFPSLKSNPDFGNPLVSWSPTGEYIASDGNVKSYIWHIDRAEIFEIIDIPKSISQLQWGGEQNILAIATNHGVGLYNIDTEETMMLTSTENVLSITWSPDYQKIAALYFTGEYNSQRDKVTTDDGIYIVNVASETIVEDLKYFIFPDTGLYHSSFAWSSDGMKLAAIGRENVFIWDSETYNIIASTDLYRKTFQNKE